MADGGFVPEPFTVEDYRTLSAPLGVTGGAVVAGSFQGVATAWLTDALERLGAGFVGVAQLDPEVSDAQLVALDAAGVRGVRFNLVRDRGRALEGLERLARRVAALVGWHAELYVDARELADLRPRLRGLEQLSIDHLGVWSEGLPAVLELVESGARVKASGFGRGDLDVPAALRAIAAADPGALMFGSDLPSTRAARPFAASDVELVLDALGEGDGRRALWDNAVVFYRL